MGSNPTVATMIMFSYLVDVFWCAMLGVGFLPMLGIKHFFFKKETIDEDFMNLSMYLGVIISLWVIVAALWLTC